MSYNIYNLTPEELRELRAAQWFMYLNGAGRPDDGDLIDPFKTIKP